MLRKADVICPLEINHPDGKIQAVMTSDIVVGTCTRSKNIFLCRGIYEVSQTYGEDAGEANTSPWVWEAGGQYFFWLAFQTVGARY